MWKRAAVAALTVLASCAPAGRDVLVQTTLAPTTTTTTTTTTTNTTTTATTTTVALRPPTTITTTATTTVVGSTTASASTGTAAAGIEADRIATAALYDGQRAMVEALPSITTGRWSASEFDAYDAYMADHTHPDIVASYSTAEVKACHEKLKTEVRTTPAAAKPGAFLELSADVATLTPAPGWTIEIAGTPVHPSGHLYRVHVTANEPVSNAFDSEADVHVGVVAGMAYWFYRLGEC